MQTTKRHTRKRMSRKKRQSTIRRRSVGGGIQENMNANLERLRQTKSYSNFRSFSRKYHPTSLKARKLYPDVTEQTLDDSFKYFSSEWDKLKNPLQATPVPSSTPAPVPSYPAPAGGSGSPSYVPHRTTEAPTPASGSYVHPGYPGAGKIPSRIFYEYPRTIKKSTHPPRSKIQQEIKKRIEMKHKVNIDDIQSVCDYINKHTKNSRKNMEEFTKTLMVYYYNEKEKSILSKCL